MKKRVAAIETIPPADAEGELAALYRRLVGSGEPSHIYQVHSLHPESLAAHVQLYRTVVSHENGCHY